MATTDTAPTLLTGVPDDTGLARHKTFGQRCPFCDAR